MAGFDGQYHQLLERPAPTHRHNPNAKTVLVSLTLMNNFIMQINDLNYFSLYIHFIHLMQKKNAKNFLIWIAYREINANYACNELMTMGNNERQRQSTLRIYHICWNRITKPQTWQMICPTSPEQLTNAALWIYDVWFVICFNIPRHR